MENPSILTRLKQLLTGESPAIDPAPPAPPPRPPAATASYDYNDPRTPDASQARIAAIRALMTEIERQATLTDGGRDALEEARRIEQVYVPKLMTSYFAIPAAHRAEIFRATGKSASFQLNERLDTLHARLAAISQGFARGQIDTFAINLGFIDDRFRASPFE